jgi:3-oxoacyl-[acyl-carrier-protein] synthase III
MTNDVAVRITGVGAEIPPDVITSAEVEERAGLRQRFGLEPGWLDTLVFTGITRDCLEPATANLVGEAMGTSTASLPLAMAEAEAAETLVPGAKVLVLAPSSGVSAAAVTMVW